MADPVSLIVLVAAGMAGDPTTLAMLRAARDALGDAPVEVREAHATPSDDDALAVEQQGHADAVVELAWIGAGRQHAKLRLHIARTGRWVERTIGFRPADAPAERGRTLGFAVASILPEVGADVGGTPGQPAAQSRPGPAPQAAQPSQTLPAQPSSQPPSPAVAAPNPPPTPAPASEPGPTVRPALVDHTSPSIPEARGSGAAGDMPLVALDLLALGATGIAGNADGAGGGVAAHWFVHRRVSLRFGGGVRAGSVDADTLTFLASAGVALHPWRAMPSRPFGLSVRADYLVVRQSTTHYDANDQSVTKDFDPRSGLDAAFDVDWLLAPSVDLVVGLGLEYVFGLTYIDSQSARVTIPVLRATAEAGARLWF
jgi:hypothetical protein